MENLVNFDQLFGGVYKGKRVLITGHTGFKGSWLSYWLEKMGAKVLGIALEPSSNPNHFELLNGNTASKIIDINNYQELEIAVKEFSPEIIFHLAAQPLVRYSYRHPLETFNTNIIGTVNILNIARSCADLRAILNVTTDKCYENIESHYFYKESDPLGGHDPYSASKACSEIVTKSMILSFFNPDNYGVSHNVLIATARAGNVIGGGDWSEDRLVPDIVRATAIGEKVEIRSPKAIRPWQHVLESLSAYLQIGQGLLSGDKTKAEAWNIGPEESMNLSVGDVLNEAQKYWSDINISFVSDQQFHEANLLMLDTSKARTQLGWSSIWNAHEAIEKTIDWYKQYYINGEVRTSTDLEEYICAAVEKNVNWV